MCIVAVLTCYNRCEKTIKCIQSILQGNDKCKFVFIVVDDNSSDGTPEAIQRIANETANVYLIEGSGQLFYSGGMRIGLNKANRCCFGDYLLLLNDDVEFFPHSIEEMIEQSMQKDNAVIVGSTCDRQGQQTYGAIKYTRGIKYKILSPAESDIQADTFNANCVLIPFQIFKKVGNMDEHYVHSLGDFDYGLSIKNQGYRIYPSNKHVGVCEENNYEKSWLNSELSWIERLKQKESVKGAPFKQWFYFLNKNFGLKTAVLSSITPFLRILLRK